MPKTVYDRIMQAYREQAAKARIGKLTRIEMSYDLYAELRREFSTDLKYLTFDPNGARAGLKFHGVVIEMSQNVIDFKLTVV